MTLTKSLLSVVSAVMLATGAAFAAGNSVSSYDAGGPELLGGPELPLSSLETTDSAYFAQSEPMMTDPMTMAESGQTIESGEVYYIVPMEVVEFEEVWLIPGEDDYAPLG